MNNKTTKNKLVNQLIELKKQEDVLRKQIEALNHDEKMSESKKYLGKYYQEIDNNKENIRCLFVYDIDKKNCEPKSLCVSYWKGDSSFFGIKTYEHFNPEKWHENEKWKEISKKVFEKHYTEALRKIAVAVNTNKN